MRKALDLTAKRYPYFCVSLKRNEREAYYVRNDSPVALLHTDQMITLGSEDTNGQIWAVCYSEEHLYLDFFHGRADGTGMYRVLATLLYYYFHPLPRALNLMESLGLERGEGKGYIRKLSIPEDVLIPFIKENDASPGILACVLMARAIERVIPEHTLPIINHYVINARPMLNAPDTFHNCLGRALLDFSDAIRRMPLDKQCTAYRGKTILQSDESTVRKLLTVSASNSQRILDLPDFDAKVMAARRSMENAFSAFSYTVSYVGRWAYPQLGEHIREFWTETPGGPFPLLELSAINGNVYISMIQTFREDVYYQVFLKELEENGITVNEYGMTPIQTAEVRF